MFNCEIGDEGCKVLTTALSAGALPQLQVLNLKRNGLGAEGASCLAACLIAGEMPSLGLLFIGNLADEHPQLKTACEARGIATGYSFG